MKAAELLESGFTQNPLAWLTPALGSVNALTPINADPPNLHDTVCGSHRKRPAAEDEDDEVNNDNGNVDTPFSAILSSLRAPTPKGAALLAEDNAVTPVVVYTGPTRSPDQIARLSVEEAAAPHHKKKVTTAVAKPSDEKAEKESEQPAANAKSAGEKPGKTGAAKAPDEKEHKGKAARWTPTSSSSLAASPPPELETKSAADKQKKQKKAEPANKSAAPTTAQ